jgi:hypothetical protein
MRLSLLLIWVGALLVIGGVLFTAAQAIWRGRLSEARTRTGGRIDTLEPSARDRSGGFALKTNWPGLALIGLGFILLLVGAAS